MIRKSSEVTDTQHSSIYILTESEELENLFSKCKSSLVKTARKELASGGKIIQIFHPNFLKYSLLGPNSLMYDIAQTMEQHSENFIGYENYWILLFALLPADPVVYAVLRKSE